MKPMPASSRAAWRSLGPVGMKRTVNAFPWNVLKTRGDRYLWPIDIICRFCPNPHSLRGEDGFAGRDTRLSWLGNSNTADGAVSPIGITGHLWC